MTRLIWVFSDCEVNMMFYAEAAINSICCYRYCYAKFVSVINFITKII